MLKRLARLLAGFGNRRTQDGHGRSETMHSTTDYARILYQHRWQSLSEWTESLEQLANMTDTQIEEIAQTGQHERSRPQN